MKKALSKFFCLEPFMPINRPEYRSHGLIKS
jgi:hypothetical protein